MLVTALMATSAQSNSFCIPVATAIMGPVHGIAFIAYVWLILSTRRDLGWTSGDLTRLLVPAFIPFGTFFNVGFLNRKAVALSE